MHLKNAIQEGADVSDPTVGEASATLDDLLYKTKSAAASFEGALVGTLIGFNALGKPLVTFCGNSAVGVAARTCVLLEKEQIGQDLVLLFDKGDPQLPIIIGVISISQSGALRGSDNLTSPVSEHRIAEVDGERLILSAEKEIVLRCGEASITLTRAGKILIRGTYLLSRSSGVNRIKGGSVELN